MYIINPYGVHDTHVHTLTTFNVHQQSNWHTRSDAVGAFLSQNYKSVIVGEKKLACDFLRNKNLKGK